MTHSCALQAGDIDAISYLGLGHVFTAMMTGNTVLLGLALAQGEVAAAGRSILALGGFVTGAAGGALIVERDGPHAAWPATVTGALAIEAAISVVSSSRPSAALSSSSPPSELACGTSNRATYGTWWCHMTKMILSHFAPSAQRAWR